MHTRPTHLDALVPQLDPEDVGLAGPHRERIAGEFEAILNAVLAEPLATE